MLPKSLFDLFDFLRVASNGCLEFSENPPNYVFHFFYILQKSQEQPRYIGVGRLRNKTFGCRSSSKSDVSLVLRVFAVHAPDVGWLDRKHENFYARWQCQLSRKSCNDGELQPTLDPYQAPQSRKEAF